MKQVTRQTLKIYWQHVRKYQWQFWLIVICISLSAVASIIVPIYYKNFFDILVDNSRSMSDRGHDMMLVVWVVFGLHAFVWLAYRIASFTNITFETRVMADLNNTCFEYLHRHSYGFFSNRFVGSLVRRVGRLVSAFEVVTDTFNWNWLQVVVSVIASLVVVFNWYPFIGFIMLAWVILYLGVNYIFAL